MADQRCQASLPRSENEHWLIVLILTVGLINGILFTRLVPPWQHYDEPGHLEFAWLIADRLKLPQQGEYDQSMRREMAASMIEYDFFKNLNFKPNLLSIDKPIWIGISQVVGSSFYYSLVALPLRLFRYSDITFQLYIGRAVSLILYLLTILVAYGILREITPPMNPLRWMVPLSLALLPGFVDIMTAVNDDVGATAVFSLFLWIGIHIIRRGISWLRFISLLLAALGCAFTKNTVLIAVVLVLIPLSIRWSRNIRRRYVFIGIMVVGLLLFLAFFRLGDAAYWHRTTNQKLPITSQKTNGAVGKEAFQFNSPKGVFQIIPQSDLAELKGKPVTIGAWIWADQKSIARTPSLRLEGKELDNKVEVGKSPAFHAFSTTMPEDLTQLWVILTPGENANHQNHIYYDGITLVEGDYSKAGTPTLLSKDAGWLNWNGSKVRNYLRNASAAKKWLVMRSTIEQWLGKFIPGAPGLYVSLLQDWRGTRWYYQVTLENLHQTFWGKVGWGHIPLPGKYTYSLLALASILGIVGTVMSLIRQWHELPLSAYLFLFISGSIIWIFTILRGLSSITATLFIPASRYALPAIVPTMLTLNMGWLEIAYWLRNQIKPPILAFIFIVLLISLDILVISSILNYYYFN